MKRSILIVFLFILSLIMVPLFFKNKFIQPVHFQKLNLNAQDRILILAPHPDDEVLGCGGIIQRARDMNIPVKIVFLTYGDNNQWSFLVYRKHPVVVPKAVQAMGLVRHDEALQADKILGLPSGQLVFLGYPDLRTLAIWYSHWADRPAAGSMLAGVKAVPYSSAFRPGAPYKGEEILADLKTIFRDFKPTKIFLSHPADHNPDHRSLYLFTRVALWDLENEIKPEIYPYIIHYKKWPKPSGYNSKLFLIPPVLFQKSIAWFSYELTLAEIEAKHNAIKQHRSQYISSKKYLLSFIRSNEPFGDFEPILLTPDFPHALMISKLKEDLAEQLSEELTSDEQALFVGIEKRSVALKDDNLIITTELSRPLGEAVGISMYVFGYRTDQDFKDMPKLHIKFGAIEHNAFDQERVLEKDAIKVSRTSKKIIISVPLQRLGNPQRILTSANTYAGAVPLDWVSWRVIEIQN